MKPKFCCFLPSAGVSIVLAASMVPAMAIVYDWDGPVGGDWDTPGHWNPDGLPGIADDVLVTVDGAATKTLSLSATPTNSTILNVGLAHTGNGTATVNQTSGTLTVTSWFNLGQGLAGTGDRTGTGIWNLSGDAVLNANHSTPAPNSGLTVVGVGFTPTGYNTGILNISGNATFNQTGADLFIGGENGTLRAKGTVNLSDNGKLLSNRPYFVGVAGNGSVGALNLSGTAQATTSFIHLGLTPDAYGAIRVDGGSLACTGDVNIGSWGAGYQTNGGHGLFELTAGTVNVNGWITMSRWGGSQSSVLNVSGGSLTYGGGGLVGNWNADGADTSVITVSGTGSISTNNNSIINLSNSGAAQNNGYLNLNGGTVTPARVIGGRGFVNFNGGTLRANSDQGDFLAVNTAQIYSGGATIDSNGRNITINQALRAPLDEGVATIPVTDGGAGYVAAPILSISGGTGSGATAVANMIPDGSGALKIGSVTITSRGNYTVAPDTVTQTGGGATTPATFGAIATTVNSSGGLTKNGAGNLTLTSNGSNYTGATQVNGGGLIVNGALQSDITVAANADFGGTGQTDGSLTFAAGDHKLLFNPSATSSFLAGSITATGATISVVPHGGFAPVSNQVILESASNITGGSFVAATPRVSVQLSEGNKVLASYAPGNLVWTGSNGTNPTFWDTSTTANWANPAADLFYTGDNVTFDDSAAPASPVTVAIQAAVQPSLVTFSNSTKDYVVSGAAIDGPAAMIKTGSGLLTMTGSNTFTGLVTVDGGTLFANVPNAPADRVFSFVSGITVNNGGTLRSSANALFGWNGSQARPITVNTGGLATVDANADVIVGLVTLNGGTLAGGPNASGWGSWSFGRAAARQLAVTENSTVSALDVAFYGGSTVDVAVGKTLSFTGTIVNSNNGPSALIKTGAGMIVLSNTNTYTGATTVSGGVLAITGTASLPGWDTSARYSVANGATLAVGNAVTDANIATMLGTTNFLAGSAIGFDTTAGDRTYNVSLANTAQGALGMTKIGANTLTLPGNNTYTGTTLVANGTLVLSGTNTGSPLQVNGANSLVRITGGTTTVPSVWNNTHVVNGSTLEINGGALSIQGGGAWFSVGHHPTLPAGTGTLTLVSGSFTNNNGWGIVVGGGNNGTGTININGGTFTADNGNNSGIILGEGAGGNGVLNLNGGLLIADQIQAGAGTGTISFNGGKLQTTGQVAIAIPASPNLTATILSGGLKVGGPQNFTISEPLAGTGGLTKEDANTVSLTAANSYTGNTTVTAGTLSLGNGTAHSNLADGSEVTIAAGATLNLNFASGEPAADTVAKLFLGTPNVQVPAGTYDSSHPTYGSYFTGTGSLIVSTGPSANDYETWANSFTPPVGAATADDDGDGLSNFEEYAFALNPKSGASANPISQQLNKGTGVFKYTRRKVAGGTGVTYTYESSTTLTGTWPSFIPVVESPNNAEPLEEVTVTVPAALLAEPKLFIRVKASK